MDRTEIEAGLEALAEQCRLDEVFLELAVYGGSALALHWDYQRSTRDVDIMVTGDATYLRAKVAEIAQIKGWPIDWMNDAVKGFASPVGTHELYRQWGDETGGLRVFTPTREYLLAMKCMAMRIGSPDGHDDVADIQKLIQTMGMTGEAQLLEIVEKYYPRSRIPSKVMFGIQEIMQDMAEKRKHGNEAPHAPRKHR